MGHRRQSERFALRLKPLECLFVGSPAHEAVKLGAIVIYQADFAESEVIHTPARAASHHVGDDRTPSCPRANVRLTVARSPETDSVPYTIRSRIRSAKRRGARLTRATSASVRKPPTSPVGSSRWAAVSRRQ